MNFRRLAAAAAVVVVPAVTMLACSSKTTKVTSGGAYFKMGISTVAKGGTCADPTTTVQISVKGDDGSDKLIANGADNAVISCSYDDNTFSVEAQGKDGYGIIAYGTFSGTNKMASADAKMSFIVAGGTYTSPKEVPCTVTFTQKADNALTGRFLCGEVDHNKIPNNSCAITGLDASGGPIAFFKFADCNPD